MNDSEAAASLLLPKVVGTRVAQAMLIWGESLEAEQALQHGLISEVVQPEQALQRALVKAAEVSSLASTSVVAIKSLMKLDRAEVRRVMDAEAEVFSRLLTGDAAREALSAFQERRPADFSGI